MPLPTDRTVDNTAAEHVADHNTVHGFVNDHGADPAAHSGIYVASPPAPSGRWTWPQSGGISTTAVNDGVCVAFPLFLSRPIDRMGIFVSGAGTAGATHRLGIWGDSAGLPGALIVDAGTVSTETTGAKEVTVAVDHVGWVWVASVPQGAPTTHATVYVPSGLPSGLSIPTLAGIASMSPRTSGVYKADVTGALPDPFGSLNGLTVGPLVLVRFA